MKKQLLFLSVSLLAAFGANADTFRLGALDYTTTSETTVEVSKAYSKDADGNPVTTYAIPSTVDYNGISYSVTAIGREAFKWNNATEVTLPETVTTIGYGAFNGCDKLTELVLPQMLESLEDYALSSTAITSIEIPASVKEIGTSTFFTAKNLSTITLHEGLEKIGTSAFYSTALENVVLPESVIELGAKAFLRCSKLKTVTLSPGISILDAGTFMDCSSLAEINIPDGVTEIGDECFLKCSSLSKIEIPATVSKLGTSVIAVTAVSEINLAEGNKDFVLVDGVLYDAAKRLLYAVPQKGKTNVTVLNQCIGINGGAFWGSEVSKVVLPDGLLAIDDYAFCQSALADINFPSSITYIGEQGFASTRLSKVVLPDNMPYVLDGAFAGCSEMTELTIPSGVKLIYNHAFHNNVNLASVTCLGTKAPEIDDVYETYDSPFYGVPETTPLYVPKGSKQSYVDAGWGSYLKITESDESTFAYTSVSPADGTVLGKWADMAVNIVFDADITIVNKKPEVFLRKGSELSGNVIEPDDCWNAVTGDNKQTLRLWASDYDGYTMSFSTEEEAEYFLVIPAGIVKNAAGDLNERIVINWHGPAAPKVLEVVSTTPADAADITPGWVDMAFNITFADDITLLDYGPDAILRKDNAVTGSKISPDDCWKAVKQDAKTLRVWGMDYDGFLQSFKVEDGVTYYMTIPAGIVQNANGDKNEEIVISFTGNSSSGIDAIGVDKVKVTGRFDISGRLVGADHKGITIIRMSDGSVRKTVVK